MLGSHSVSFDTYDDILFKVSPLYYLHLLGKLYHINTVQEYSKQCSIKSAVFDWTSVCNSYRCVVKFYQCVVIFLPVCG